MWLGQAVRAEPVLPLPAERGNGRFLGRPRGVGRSRGRVWAALPDSPLALPQLGLRNDALLREIRAAQQRLGFGDPAL